MRQLMIANGNFQFMTRMGVALSHFSSVFHVNFVVLRVLWCTLYLLHRSL